MNVVIIEDESLTAKNLSRLLKQIEPMAEIIATLDSVTASVKWLQENKQPDLFFMDIQLADGVSFDIFNKVKIEFLEHLFRQSCEIIKVITTLHTDIGD